MLTEKSIYIRTTIFGLIVFVAFFAYTNFLKIPNAVNKSFADTAILLMGLSMAIKSIAYFFHSARAFLLYRKQLGLIGFGFLVGHIALSFSAFLSLFTPKAWSTGIPWPMFTGFVAGAIFTVMAAISFQKIASLLNGTLWRRILQMGYIALLLSVIHVILLKFGRWSTWYREGVQTAPSTSLVVAFITGIVLFLRIIYLLTRKKRLS